MGPYFYIVANAGNSHACWPKQQLPASLEPEDSLHPEWKAVKDTFCCCLESLSWLSLSPVWHFSTQHTSLIYKRCWGNTTVSPVTQKSDHISFKRCEFSLLWWMKTLPIENTKTGPQRRGGGFSHKQKQKVREIGQWTGKNIKGIKSPVIFLLFLLIYCLSSAWSIIWYHSQGWGYCKSIAFWQSQVARDNGTIPRKIV